MRTQTTTGPTPAAPALRFYFVYDDDAVIHGCDGKPLPELPEVYAESPCHGPDGQPIPYDEYCRYYGNPDRHVALGAVVQRQCPCCQHWEDVGSLWGIDYMDDAAEVAAIEIGTVGSRRTRRYYSQTEALTLPGYWQDVIPELIADAADVPVGVAP